jgi:hypothetical protein
VEGKPLCKVAVIYQGLQISRQGGKGQQTKGLAEQGGGSQCSLRLPLLGT